jgi:hypothetical protein
VPIPVLVIGSFVGLVLYGVIGGISSAVTMRVIAGKKETRKVIRGDQGHYVAPGYALAGVFWPAWLAILVVGGTLLAVFVGPVWLGLKVFEYGGDALTQEEVPNAA